MSWADVGCDEPVRGRPDEYTRVSARWRTAATNAQNLSTTFDRIVADVSSIGFQGQAADAFQSIIAESQNVLDDVPAVCGDLSRVMADHAAKLAALQAEASAALARARTAWGERADAQARSDQARANAERVRRQIRSLQGYPPEQVGGQLQTLHYNLGVENRNAAVYDARSSAANSRLQTELRNAAAYRRREREIDETTAARLHCIDPRSLEDPTGWFNTLREFVEEVGEFLGDVWTVLKPFVEQAFIVLRDVLEVVLDILAFASLVLLVVMLFVPGLNVIAFGLAVAVFALAATKLTTTVALTNMGTTDPKTGQKFNWGDVGVDAISVGFAALGVVGSGAGAIMSTTKITKLTRAHVLVNKVDILSSKPIVGAGMIAAGNTPRIVEDVVQNDDSLATVSEVRGLVYLVQPSLMIGSITSPDRRLSAPCSCQLAPIPMGAR